MNKKKLIWQLPFLVVLIVGTVIIPVSYTHLTLPTNSRV